MSEIKFKDNEPRFKVGDKVKIVKKYSNGKNIAFYGGELVFGAEYEIFDVDGDNCEFESGIVYPYQLKHTHLYVEECMLELVEESATTSPPLQYNPLDVAFHKNTARWWLEKAIDVQKERGKNYDKNEERSAGKVADIFNILRDKDLTETDVFLILQILKQVRYCQHFDNPHEDSLLDNIAYASLFAEAAMRKQA